jgi:orotidine-5'-phosphate decarboxylase
MSHHSKFQEPQDRIIVALDVPTAADAEQLVRQLEFFVGAFKVGLELISAIGGPNAVRCVQRAGGRVFYDGKFHDIPNTVAGAVRGVVRQGVSMLNVHCSGGIPMMRAAVENRGEAMVLGVTVLTSLDEAQTHHVYGELPRGKVLQLAFDAQAAGLDGVICSPQELALLKREDLGNLIKVTPGVRPTWAPADDQKRVMTPGEAVAAGADYLVIGRPITKPPAGIGSPVDAVKRIVEEIELAEVQS